MDTNDQPTPRDETPFSISRETGAPVADTKTLADATDAMIELGKGEITEDEYHQRIGGGEPDNALTGVALVETPEPDAALSGVALVETPEPDAALSGVALVETPEPDAALNGEALVETPEVDVVPEPPVIAEDPNPEAEHPSPDTAASDQVEPDGGVATPLPSGEADETQATSSGGATVASTDAAPESVASVEATPPQE